jgi:hypothetical protein
MSDALGRHHSSDDVRYASDSDRIAAPPRSVALGAARESVNSDCGYRDSVNSIERPAAVTTTPLGVPF